MKYINALGTFTMSKVRPGETRTDLRIETPTGEVFHAGRCYLGYNEVSRSDGGQDGDSNTHWRDVLAVAEDAARLLGLDWHR